MRGCRPLSDAEVAKILCSFQGYNAKRTAAMFMLGLKTGFRISELLCLRIKDLIFRGNVVEILTVDRRYLKGGKKSEDKKGKPSSRPIPLNAEVHPAVLEQWRAIFELHGLYAPETYFFQSWRPGNSPIDRVQAWRDLRAVYDACGFHGRIGTHGMRKTFARQKLEFLREIWEPGQPTPMEQLQPIMGHASLQSTQSYVAFADENFVNAFLQS